MQGVLRKSIYAAIANDINSSSVLVTIMDLTLSEEVETAFKKLGLTREQIRIYIYLAENGPKTVRDICIEMKKDRAAAYKHLEKLLNSGLVDRGLSSTNIYIARPVSRLREIFVDALEEQHRREKILVEAAIKSLEGMSHSSKFDYESQYRMIFGRKRLYQELRKEFSKTYSEYRLISSANGILRSVRHGLVDDYHDMLKRGIRIMIIGEVNQFNLAEAAMLYQLIPFKHQSGMQLRLNIFDQERVLLGAIQHDDDFSLERQDDSYMLITDRNFAKGFIRLFDTIYSGLEDAWPLIAKSNPG